MWGAVRGAWRHGVVPFSVEEYSLGFVHRWYNSRLRTHFCLDELPSLVVKHACRDEAVHDDPHVQVRRDLQKRGADSQGLKKQCNKIRNHCVRKLILGPPPPSPWCERHLWMVLRWFLSEHDGRCRAIIIEIAPSRPFTSFLCSARLQSASVACVHFGRWRRRRITFCWGEPIFVRNHLHFTKLRSYNVHYLKLEWCKDVISFRKENT